MYFVFRYAFLWSSFFDHLLRIYHSSLEKPRLIPLFFSVCLIFGCLITLEIMYLLIVFLPLLGSSVAGFFGRFLGSEGTAIVTTTCVSFSSILSLIAFYEVAPGASACYLRIAPWISSEMFDASWGFFGDREVTG
jgi:uncharacterized BrkB/YihY/UPF0761 family membrane protein